MKKAFIIIALAISLALPSTISAQSACAADSCYVYSYLHFAGKAYKAYGGKVRPINSTEEQPILSADNTETEFTTWTAAMSYLSALGWEFVCIDDHNPEIVSQNDRYILIRKRTTKEEAVSLSLPTKDGK